jgi:hypothetical protein
VDLFGNIKNNLYIYNMDPEIKETLYNELQEILILMEDMDNNMAIIKLEDLINKIQYDQL